MFLFFLNKIIQYNVVSLIEQQSNSLSTYIVWFFFYYLDVTADMSSDFLIFALQTGF